MEGIRTDEHPTLLENKLGRLELPSSVTYSRRSEFRFNIKQRLSKYFLLHALDIPPANVLPLMVFR
jgi:hypothetical protein